MAYQFGDGIGWLVDKCMGGNGDGQALLAAYNKEGENGGFWHWTESAGNNMQHGFDSINKDFNTIYQSNLSGWDKFCGCSLVCVGGAFRTAGNLLSFGGTEANGAMDQVVETAEQIAGNEDASPWSKCSASFVNGARAVLNIGTLGVTEHAMKGAADYIDENADEATKEQIIHDGDMLVKHGLDMTGLTAVVDGTTKIAEQGVEYMGGTADKPGLLAYWAAKFSHTQVGAYMVAGTKYALNTVKEWISPAVNISYKERGMTFADVVNEVKTKAQTTIDNYNANLNAETAALAQQNGYTTGAAGAEAGTNSAGATQTPSTQNDREAQAAALDPTTNAPTQGDKQYE